MILLIICCCIILILFNNVYFIIILPVNNFLYNPQGYSIFRKDLYKQLLMKNISIKNNVINIIIIIIIIFFKKYIYIYIYILCILKILK